jgi:hypothetical protein
MRSRKEAEISKFVDLLQEAPPSLEEVAGVKGKNVHELSKREKLVTEYVCKARTCISSLCGELYLTAGVRSSKDSRYKGELETVYIDKILNTTVLPVPASYAAKDAASLLSYASLYSENGVLVLPFGIENGDISYSGGGMPLGRTSTDTLMKTIFFNHHYRNVVEQGGPIFLPQYFRNRETSLSRYHDFYSRAPFLQDPHALNFTPVNPVIRGTTDLTRHGETLLVAQFLLPFFPKANLQDVVRIKGSESDAFVLFNSYLRQRLASLSDAESLDDIDDIQSEINAGVAKLRIEAKKVSGSKLLRNTEIGLLTVSLAAIASRDSSLAHVIAGMTGSASLFSLLHSFNEVRGKHLDMRSSEYFIPYLLAAKEDTH